MDFRLPYSWLKEYVAVPTDATALAQQLSQYGASIDRVQAAKHDFDDVIVAEITHIEKHPNADKLQIAMVKTGEKKERRIVCGAPNIAVGQKVPLALPGATLPGDFAIAQRDVRGVVSEGMLCSGKELGLSDDHAGILLLHPNSPVGKKLLDLGVADERILEVEPTTNRPDIASVLGVAREVSAVTGKPVKYRAPKSLPKGASTLRVEVKDKKLCPRFMAVVVENVRVVPSPWFMQERLVRAGIRPINALVDITNYVMLEYGRPMHVFDADKLGDTIVVRKARAGESIRALDGKTYELAPSHVVVADAKKPVSIAGSMGGEETGVTTQTTRVVFEIATWDPVSVRRAGRDLRLSTDASKLFDKGLSAAGLEEPLARAVALATEVCGGRVAGGVVDVVAAPYRPKVVTLHLADIPRLLGVDVPATTVRALLARLGFTVVGSGKTLRVTVPHWRDHDVAEPEDVLEEIARLYGYHRIEPDLPALSLAIPPATVFDHEYALKKQLQLVGFTEVYSSSLIRDAWLQALRYPAERALRLANPLSSDQAYLRPSLLPSLVATVHDNEAHHDRQWVFEIAAVYETGDQKRKGVDAYRTETSRLVAVVSDHAATVETLYRQVKGLVEMLGATATRAPGTWPFASTASVTVARNNETIGTVGLLDPAFLKEFGVSSPVAAFDVRATALAPTGNRTAYQAVPKYPAIKRDIALVVGPDVHYTDLVAAIREHAPLIEDVSLFDIYQSRELGEGNVSYALHVTYRSAERTLTTADVDAEQERMLSYLTNTFGVRLRT